MNFSILVVDDEEGIRLTFASFLNEAGYNTSVARNFQEARVKISEAEYDLLFLDIVLEGESGLDLLKEVKSRHPHCLVVMVTGYPELENAKTALRYGASDYLTKPVEEDELLRVAEVMLKQKALVDENAQSRTHLEAIFESVKDGILSVDKELKVIGFNHSMETICGFTPGVTGESLDQLMSQCSGRCRQVLIESVTFRKKIEVQRFECHPSYGSRKIITLNASPLIDQLQRFMGSVLVLRDETRLVDLEKNLLERKDYAKIIGKSLLMARIYDQIDSLADIRTSVLITGESGTGKELVAEALHYQGARAEKPLVKCNCVVLTENLIESELFGHVKGAFTGADRDKIGRFEQANGGTIFLDEIGDISPTIQLKLLRVLQDKEFEKVGSIKNKKVDIRVIAATNQDLHEKVNRGQFREDLYYRLKVVEIEVPPLRERKEDIPLLLSQFLKDFGKEFKKTINGLTEDAKKLLMEHDWPGNVRELRHAIEHASIVCKQSIITLDDLPRDLKNQASLKKKLPKDKTGIGYQDLMAALKSAEGKKARAARMLGISRQTFYKKLRQFNINA
ncbi:MAG: sigma 54-interacting transcriptional regulator [Deltaproteobacteria bacterium]|jgi:two-component system, NtrC family, response regulator HydG|nr:sigma 54-interacting transcriptional regulator [Deltaproteobacteria bacterium]MBT4091704.1 sigma 54-interacting transcriptional regulator [Deltaproteobacteria bacterium]MBT4263053.1 sigma 54-interacting transcriptional regulator [Deltaproteobacteria bacterium]MBT4643404.1 sigma 54-interacting transcriptional regulator [Deltaproteobacteria bacterium]MBT6502654.1 sigma 54-interacting transcriptional regulator [Deltaproteobacteria bacterium]